MGRRNMSLPLSLFFTKKRRLFIFFPRFASIIYSNYFKKHPYVWDLSLQYSTDYSEVKRTRIIVDTCTYGYTFSKSKHQSGKAANPARGQLNMENEYFPVPVRAS